ncbi:MAG: ABC transporter permease [Ruaniaceae bacterium]|nr:ABC transporter permease [Ruaniaceae bacterium]
MKDIARRILAIIPTLLGVLIGIFFLTRILPGDPARTIAGEQASAETVEKIRVEMGLDQTLGQQFITYVGNLFRGDFGLAWHTGHPVAEDLAARLPATIELGLTALLIAVVVGIPLGVVSAVRRGKFIDQASRVIALIGASMPLFWLGLLLLVLFYSALGWAPAPMGRVPSGVNPPTSITGLYILDSILSGDMKGLIGSLRSIALPAICLSLGSMAVTARMMRSTMLETLGQDYVRTAHSKGLAPRVVIWKHAMKNAAPVIVTVIGLQVGQMLGGAVITETIFAGPGVGSYVTNAIMATDYAPVQAFTLIAALVYLFVNLIVDITNARLDPRIRNV